MPELEVTVFGTTIVIQFRGKTFTSFIRCIWVDWQDKLGTDWKKRSRFTGDVPWKFGGNFPRSFFHDDVGNATERILVGCAVHGKELLIIFTGGVAVLIHFGQSGFIQHALSSCFDAGEECPPLVPLAGEPLRNAPVTKSTRGSDRVAAFVGKDGTDLNIMCLPGQGTSLILYLRSALLCPADVPFPRLGHVRYCYRPA
jgi:hypothetical protein